MQHQKMRKERKRYQELSKNIFEGEEEVCHQIKKVVVLITKRNRKKEKKKKKEKINNKYINNINYNYCFISIEFSNI